MGSSTGRGRSGVHVRGDPGEGRPTYTVVYLRKVNTDVGEVTVKVPSSGVTTLARGGEPVG